MGLTLQRRMRHLMHLLEFDNAHMGIDLSRTDTDMSQHLLLPVLLQQDFLRCSGPVAAESIQS